MEKSKIGDITTMPTPEIKMEISKLAEILMREKMLPNGLGQLIVGSVQYRKQALFYDSGANKGHYMGDPELDQLWEEWAKQYDGFLGDNLVATASYQRDGNLSNDTFPKPETQEYTALVERMRMLGKYVKEFYKREGWEKMKDTLGQIEQANFSG